MQEFFSENWFICFINHIALLQALFKTLRRLHGQNLENQGLNNLTEAFQNFMTRAKYFSISKIR